MLPKRKKKKEESWADSEGKKLLLQDLRSGVIPLDPNAMKPATAFRLRPDAFSVPNYAEGMRLFAGRLRAAREQIKEKRERSSLEAAALEEDRKVHPKPTTNHRGEPRWEGSAAERLLKDDIAAGKHKTMTPMQLFHSRPEYQSGVFTLRVFRDHIYQEERLLKFIAQCRACHNRR